MYRIIPNLDTTPARIALAPTRTQLADAYADMGEGIVIDNTGRIVAFHQRHLPALERRASRGEALRVA